MTLQVKTWYPNYTNLSLCVMPTAGETQYESFQSIFASIFNSENDSPYRILCGSSDIALIPTNSTNAEPLQMYINGYDRIVYYNDTEESTHYKAYFKKQRRNPYDQYQAFNTQGYCQMFAYFLAIDDLTGFTPVNQHRRIDIPAFNALATNNQACFTKAWEIIKTKIDVVTAFREKFDKIVNTPKSRIDSGIKSNTSLDKYITDFLALNANIGNVKLYVYDNPLEGYEIDYDDPQDGYVYGVKKPELWHSFMYDAVEPTIIRYNDDTDNASTSTIVGGKRNKKPLKGRKQTVKSKKQTVKSKKQTVKSKKQTVRSKKH